MPNVIYCCDVCGYVGRKHGLSIKSKLGIETFACYGNDLTGEECADEFGNTSILMHYYPDEPDASDFDPLTEPRFTHAIDVLLASEQVSMNFLQAAE